MRKKRRSYKDEIYEFWNEQSQPRELIDFYHFTISPKDFRKEPVGIQYWIERWLSRHDITFNDTASMTIYPDIRLIEAMVYHCTPMVRRHLCCSCPDVPDERTRSEVCTKHLRRIWSTDDPFPVRRPLLQGASSTR